MEQQKRRMSDIKLKTNLVHIRMTDDLRKKVEKAAQKAGVTISEWIRGLVGKSV
jgi:antitoxin component of RelBE/YafQ-DinJ toxin-antitoxin module